MIFVVGPVSKADDGTTIPDLVSSALSGRRFRCRVGVAREPKRTSRLTTRTESGRTSVIITMNNSNAIGRMTHSLIRSSSTLNVLPYNSKGNLTHRLLLPVGLGGDVRVVGTYRVRSLSCKIVGRCPFFYAYKVNFSTFIDVGFTRDKGHKPVDCTRGVLERNLGCRPRACALRSRAKAGRCGTFLVSYTGTSRCNGGTCVTPRTSVDSKLVSMIVVRPFSIVRTSRIDFSVFGGALSGGSGVGSFQYGGLRVAHDGPNIVRCSNSPIVANTSVSIRVRRGNVGVVMGPFTSGDIHGPGIVRSTFTSFFGSVGIMHSSVRGSVRHRDGQMKTVDGLMREGLGL